jgi:ATP-binding cassette subfamily E protein 1
MQKRIVVLDKDLCKPKKCNYQCMKVCPKNRSSENCIKINEETKFPVFSEEICIGCGLCIHACDRAGFKAITIVNLPHELEEKPIHRFGPNEFVLYRLPAPVLNEVVGLIGTNGVGKTTALKVLSGELSPNMGEFEKQITFGELVKTFRGTELQAYFEKLEKKDINVSYKPQRVDQIPTVFKEKVSKLLEKTDERKILNDLTKTMGLDEIMQKNINEISGGELQKVAIAACLAKDADVYYIDEPTSFLDVFQRLAVAKAIRKFCANKSAMVVDHDLATLDFLADRIHIFYGTPGAYGVVSKPYGVRVGINTFLEGYIKEDNVKIRSEPITFFTSILDKKISPEVLISFNNISKKFDNFLLEIDGGDIRNKEVLAAMGANALGKTTFAKILAGEIKQDSGSIDKKIKISYKPQYIKTDFIGTVRELLSTVADTTSDNYKAEIMRPLSIEGMMEKNVGNLSGGELQRVAIALCLSQQVNLYLLDEPSAFLDVEQRLAVAKMISRIVEVKEKSAMVIDHDLLFLSQVGSRAILFTGKSGVSGRAGEMSIKDAFNMFLTQVNVTFRKDPQTGRPRANKFDSQLDKEQKEIGKYFYV